MGIISNLYLLIHSFFYFIEFVNVQKNIYTFNLVMKQKPVYIVCK